MFERCANTRTNYINVFSNFGVRWDQFQIGSEHRTIIGKTRIFLILKSIQKEEFIVVVVVVFLRDHQCYMIYENRLNDSCISQKILNQRSMRNRFNLNTLLLPLNVVDLRADERRNWKNQINFQRLLRLFHQNHLYTHWCILHVTFWGRGFLSLSLSHFTFHISFFRVISCQCMSHCERIMRR